MKYAVTLSVALLLFNPVFALETIRIEVDGTPRTALVHLPAGDGPHPVVFAYHGAGGTSQQFQAMARFEEHWSEAVVVYPQGLSGGSGDRLNPEGKLTGWQTRPRIDGDRDVRFFDRLVAELGERTSIDQGRIYVTGQSNGGGHVFLLWLARGDRIAAFGPCAGQTSPEILARLAPKPFLMVSGQQDTTVPFQNQVKVHEALRAKLEPLGLPFAIVTHPGGHSLPNDAPGRLMAFFRTVDAR